jgi:molybdopterin-guanine dinucleotide biosynthesis protein MobB
MHVFGITGWKNSGKTTLVVKLVNYLVAQGYSVSTIKHAHHAFDIDQPGRDSFLHREAGATEVLVASQNRWALIHELRNETEIPLEEALLKLQPVDIVLVEGYKAGLHPKLQVIRPTHNADLMMDTIPNIVAVASDAAMNINLPLLDLNDTTAIANFIVSYLSLQKEHA